MGPQGKERARELAFIAWASIVLDALGDFMVPFPEALLGKAEGTAVRILHPNGITNFMGVRSTGQGLSVRLICLASQG